MSEATKSTRRKVAAGSRWVRLEDVAVSISKGTTPLSYGFRYTPNGVVFLRAENLGLNGAELSSDTLFVSEECDEYIKRSRLMADDVLISIAGTLGRVSFVPNGFPRANCNQAVCFVRLRRELADRDYVVATLRSHRVQQQLQSQGVGGGVTNLNLPMIRSLEIPLPPLAEQRRIAGMLREQMGAVEKARAAAQARLEAAVSLPAAFARESFRNGQKYRRQLGECLIEVRNGVGADWSNYPVLGATREGLAPAKESVGKMPERYKLVDAVTVFYNPMRILLGSIAMVDDGDPTGITSPDYVVVKGRSGILDTRWFYYWFRSAEGAHLIDSLSRGAVRERILFNRLAAGEIDIPDYETQLHASSRMKQVRPIVETITQELNTINALPAALLRRAFNGET